MNRQQQQDLLGYDGLVIQLGFGKHEIYAEYCYGNLLEKGHLENQENWRYR
jgi:hypothetical protein